MKRIVGTSGIFTLLKVDNWPKEHWIQERNPYFRGQMDECDDSETCCGHANGLLTNSHVYVWAETCDGWLMSSRLLWSCSWFSRPVALKYKNPVFLLFTSMYYWWNIYLRPWCLWSNNIIVIPQASGKLAKLSKSTKKGVGVGWGGIYLRLCLKGGPPSPALEPLTLRRGCENVSFVHIYNENTH